MNKKNKISRRGLFKSGVKLFGKMADEFLSATENTVDENRGEEFYTLDKNRALLRPPGAVALEEFDNLCTKCDDCIDACPEQVLFHAPVLAGSDVGIPVFDPRRKACFLCSDLYCITACKEGALLMPESISSLHMGAAKIDPTLCLAQRGGNCTVCFDFCPLAGSAIAKKNGAPTIETSRCVGCGLCEYYCMKETGANAITTTPHQA